MKVFTGFEFDWLDIETPDLAEMPDLTETPELDRMFVFGVGGFWMLVVFGCELFDEFSWMNLGAFLTGAGFGASNTLETGLDFV